FIFNKVPKVDRDKAVKGPVKLTFAGNLLAPRLHLFTVNWQHSSWPGPEELKDSLRRRHRFSEDNNLYGNLGGFSETAHIYDQKFLKQEPGPFASLKEWQDFWGTGGAKASQGVARFEGGDLYPRLEADPWKLQPADFRLAKGSPGKGKGEGGKDL